MCTKCFILTCGFHFDSVEQVGGPSNRLKTETLFALSEGPANASIQAYGCRARV